MYEIMQRLFVGEAIMAPRMLHRPRPGKVWVKLPSVVMSKHCPSEPIQPKPTTYQGVRFRSRLEARWAVFLDFCHNVLNWKYEPVTCILKPENWEYTPDFLVKLHVRPEWGAREIYLECKPKQSTEEYTKTLHRACGILGKPIFVLTSSMFFKQGEGIKINTSLIVHPNEAGFPIALGHIFDNEAFALQSALNYRFDLKD